MTAKSKLKRKKWEWELREIIDPVISEEEMKELINKKLAYIIVELEHNPISYINTENLVIDHCKLKEGALQ